MGGYGREDWKGREAIVANIRTHLGGCGPTQHLLSNYKVEVNGDTARYRAAARLPYWLSERVSLKPFEIWAFYFDDLVCTKEGWRIVVRQERTAIATGDIGVLRPD